MTPWLHLHDIIGVKRKSTLIRIFQKPSRHNGIKHVLSPKNSGTGEISPEQNGHIVCHVLSVERVDFKKRIH
jgi:hypothetical protein